MEGLQGTARVWWALRHLGPPPQVCDAVFCPPLPTVVAGALPLRQLQRKMSKSCRKYWRLTALACISADDQPFSGSRSPPQLCA